MLQSRPCLCHQRRVPVYLWRSVQGRAQGFDDQYGIESYWNIDLLEWLRVTADLQIVNNIDDDIELVPGFRIKLHKTF